MTFTWQGGRQLASVTRDGVTTSYTYNENGLRTTKTTGTETTNYYYSGDVLTGLETADYSLLFHYDENGGIIGYTKHTAATDTEYFYVKNLQGDILQVIDAAGTTVAQYSYDAWGNILTATGTEAAINPIRYRGYYFDTETELYYVSNRYYDSEVDRFIFSDVVVTLVATPMELTDKNLYAYCDNNPINRVDHGGQFWETVFDVISLGASIVEVCVNPTDPWAWAGLVGDAIDLIPLVTGVGEITRGVKTTIAIADKADDVVDTAKAIYRAADNTSDVKKATGSYEILFKSGKNYVGKGGFDRAIQSAQRYDDIATSIMWKSAPNAQQAFFDEYMMQIRRGVLSSNPFAETYNKIWSPGKKLLGK